MEYLITWKGKKRTEVDNTWVIKSWKPIIWNHANLYSYITKFKLFLLLSFHNLIGSVLFNLEVKLSTLDLYRIWIWKLSLSLFCFAREVYWLSLASVMPFNLFKKNNAHTNKQINAGGNSFEEHDQEFLLLSWNWSSIAIFDLCSNCFCHLCGTDGISGRRFSVIPFRTWLQFSQG